MGQILAQGGVLTLAVIGLLAWGFARVLDGPRWTGQAILLILVLVALAGQLLLPPEAPFRQSVGGAMRALIVVGIAAIPILAYRRVLGRLRRARDGAEPAPAGAVTGRAALVEETGALAADLDRTLGTQPSDRFGLIHRRPDGQLAAGAVVSIDARRARVAPVWWAEDADPETVVRPLIAAIAAAANERGAVRVEIETEDELVADAFAAEGFARTDPAPLHRLSRSLP